MVRAGMFPEDRGSERALLAVVVDGHAEIVLVRSGAASEHDVL